MGASFEGDTKHVRFAKTRNEDMLTLSYPRRDNSVTVVLPPPQCDNQRRRGHIGNGTVRHPMKLENFLSRIYSGPFPCYRWTLSMGAHLSWWTAAYSFVNRAVHNETFCASGATDDEDAYLVPIVDFGDLKRVDLGGKMDAGYVSTNCSRSFSRNITASDIPQGVKNVKKERQPICDSLIWCSPMIVFALWIRRQGYAADPKITEVSQNPWRGVRLAAGGYELTDNDDLEHNRAHALIYRIVNTRILSGSYNLSSAIL
ncbi:hypothetical protein IW261DRAFT_1424974 [Armillaria novae-zelandiae]|uniref:Uncharacterized protein n=1 Tax=Armillaria novae-zelandiae TaxID=153914 RepID=A0AA39UAG2_9AGAR|nr:hypothetical protein IW261DRAFT_1424974 [Armillaria novae-zelandiae]